MVWIMKSISVKNVIYNLQYFLMNCICSGLLYANLKFKILPPSSFRVMLKTLQNAGLNYVYLNIDRLIDWLFEILVYDMQESIIWNIYVYVLLVFLKHLDWDYGTSLKINLEMWIKHKTYFNINLAFSIKLLSVVMKLFVGLFKADLVLFLQINLNINQLCRHIWKDLTIIKTHSSKSFF